MRSDFRNRFSRPRGFTLLELIVAVAIVAVLAAALTPVIIGSVEKARFDKAQADMSTIADAFRRFRSDTGVWPDGSTTWIVDSEGCFAPESLDSSHSALFTVPTGTTQCTSYTQLNTKACWLGPYVNGDAQTAFGVGDPWGNPYKVFLVANTASSNACPLWSTDVPSGSIVVYSLGPNLTDNSQSNLANLAKGTGAGDDIVYVVTLSVL